MYDYKLISLIRRYLSFETKLVETKSGIPTESLRKIEEGLLPLPYKLVDFYANELNIKSCHLNAILASPRENAILQAKVNRFVRLYLQLVLRLRVHE